MLKAKALMIAGLSGLLVACSANDVSDKSAPDSAAAHEQAIRKTNEQWLALIRDHDAAAVSMLYTADGAMMAPGAPIAQGQPALETAWGGLMQMPGFALTFEADQIVVASGGDMALDRGVYQLSLDGPDGAMKDIGKYVVVWRNVDGQWKVAADIFNSDGAPTN
ncbi:MAG: hypothetical protein A3E78_12810 [Alphaproteobacteria bacterium RIFCSPHIGHO2_12_FULL_63_12]|nr:MAG: hypothetical protein A3E78_12810 [Alphaproteobacteria bacterium RIFCSPHIGHO2_12_FULL_63_12]